jgi:hypothetical protein
LYVPVGQDVHSKSLTVTLVPKNKNLPGWHAAAGIVLAVHVVLLDCDDEYVPGGQPTHTLLSNVVDELSTRYSPALHETADFAEHPNGPLVV